MLGQIPLFVWPGILGLIGLYVAAMFIFAARKLRSRQLRKYHAIGATISLVLITVHALWALSLLL